MTIAEKYDPSFSLRQKISYVLATLHKASANEVAIEVVELDGVSAEEAVAEITIEINKELKKMDDEGVVEKLREHRQKVRYVLNNNAVNNKRSPLKSTIMSHVQNAKLMDALAKCAAECSHCATACLQEQDVKMLERCIKLDLDCAEICEVATGFVARGSEHAEHIIRLCAEICTACAEECEKHSHMEHCRRCAEACRKCAEACQAGVAA